MLFSPALSVVPLFAAFITATTVPLHQRRQDNATSGASNSTSSNATYDFVVVGSGAGGGPLAARLAMANFSVLLIDAGDDQGAALPQQVPALQLQSTEYTPMRWDFYVNHYQDEKRQAQDSKMTYRDGDGKLHVNIHGAPPANSTPLGILYPRAGTLGGCTAHNALITIYPFASDWQNIADLTGNDTWAPGNMRKYFERLENFHYPVLPNVIPGLPGIDYTSQSGHGLNGWLSTERTSLKLVVKDLKLQALIVAAAHQIGQLASLALLNTLDQLKQILSADLNNDGPDRDTTEGLYQVPIATHYGQRNGARELVVQTQQAKNADGTRKYRLDVQLQTLVTKVRFDQSGARPKAVGLDYLTGPSLYRADPRAKTTVDEGTPGSVDARLEVILSAGAFNTPQLLKLSGVGPRDELAQFQIGVVKDLPAVGTNLQDRYETGLVGKTQSSNIPIFGQTDPDFAITKDCKFLMDGAAPGDDPCLDQWQKDPTGDRGTYSTNGIAIGLVKKSSQADSSDPDLFIAGVPAIFRGYYPGYSVDAFQDADHWTWITLKAHSRNTAGKVTLKSGNPRDTPTINFNSFDTGTTAAGADEKDLQATVEGMKFSRSLFSTAPGFKYTEEWPSNNVTTDEQWKDFVKQEAWGHHASCTCPMGATGDEQTSVVDSDFRVQGIDGLRIVDASVFPKIPGFYIVTPIYMISEKAAETIIAEHGGVSYEAQGDGAKNASNVANRDDFLKWAP